MVSEDEHDRRSKRQKRYEVMCSSPGDGAEEGSEDDGNDSSSGGVDSEAFVLYFWRDVFILLRKKIEAALAARNEAAKTFRVETINTNQFSTHDPVY